MPADKSRTPEVETAGRRREPDHEGGQPDLYLVLQQQNRTLQLRVQELERALHEASERQLWAAELAEKTLQQALANAAALQSSSAPYLELEARYAALDQQSQQPGGTQPAEREGGADVSLQLDAPRARHDE